MDREVYTRIREAEQKHWWFTARREILTDQISRLGLPAAAQVLEVGCGTGGNLAMLADFGEVSAIEPDHEARAYAASRSGIMVRDGLLPHGLPKFETRFDLVAAFDVIEHVDDDAGAVAAIGELLTPGGYFIATVPANQWMWSSHDERHHHKRRYKLRAFEKLFVDTGLEVRKATYFNTLLFPVIGTVRLAKSAVGAHDGDDETMPSPFLNRTLHRLFVAEKPLLHDLQMPFGVSILTIAQRRA